MPRSSTHTGPGSALAGPHLIPASHAGQLFSHQDRDSFFSCLNNNEKKYNGRWLSKASFKNLQKYVLKFRGTWWDLFLPVRARRGAVSGSGVGTADGGIFEVVMSSLRSATEHS